MEVTLEQKPELVSELADLRRVPLSQVLDDPELAGTLQRVVPGWRDASGAEWVPVAAFNSCI
jgi:hypothetical protein